ncbi:hypothetical protein DICSQDRAFT_166078 [Dichomitus squalens LYAD-421 SS1]|uniref:uncharacterized protein n=1 Tax=Dichomitus squalens (strain LYAD-421) TaxID=732165 RepID=UPI0004412281|nr:uncharacterized protein DICSQDRAFT_166078 [Dichomitus squalens LYAD-421 SS1]EJF65017.1 hypothetical protein DICSQDRAFT_166078 [Dichomitus squalens LYAD-421 SS1]
MANSLLSLRGGLCLTIVTLYATLFVLVGLSTRVSGRPAQVNAGSVDTASVIFGHNTGDVFLTDEYMSSATPAMLSAFMMSALLFMSAFLFVKAIRTQIGRQKGLPIPVSRLAGIDTIEDIFKLGKRASGGPDVTDSLTEHHRRHAPFATPGKPSRTSPLKESVPDSSVASPAPSTPLLVSSIDSPSVSSPRTPYDPLYTPVLPPFCPRGDSPDFKKTRRVFGILVNRSPTKSGSEDFDPDDGHYLRAALGLTHMQSPPRVRNHWRTVNECAVHEK